MLVSNSFATMIISTAPIATSQPAVRAISPAETKTNASSTTITSGKQTRRVRFNQTVAVRPIAHVDDLSDDDLDALWFASNDFVKMKKSFSVTLQSISEGFYAGDDDRHCARGLEHRTERATLKRRRNRWHAIGAVLLEQKRQRDLGIKNDELISEVYTEENLHCRLAALKLGVQDQKHTEELWLGICDCTDIDNVAVENFQRITKAATRAPTRRSTASRSPVRCGDSA